MAFPAYANHVFLALCLLFSSAATAHADSGSPFSARAVFTGDSDNVLSLTVILEAPPGGAVDAASLELLIPEGYRCLARELPPPAVSAEYPDGFYRQGAVLRYRISPAEPPPPLRLRLQGCLDGLCLLPQEIELAPETELSRPAPSGSQDSGSALPALADFSVTKRSAGYQPPRRFLAWLKAETAPDNPLATTMRRFGVAAAALLTFLSGILLNLTPCILPVIPVTAGILGIRENSRRRGVLTGCCYGGAIALTYGLLGVFAITVGGRFADFTSSGVFNLLTAVIFFILAAAMADFIHIDFSRFRRPGSVPAAAQKGTATAAILLGVMTALLSGACVAPVLLWMLLLSVELWAHGNPAAWFLPFALGCGFGAPWPLFGLFLRFLPRPGAWMLSVKRIFAAIILICGLCYLLAAWRSFAPAAHSPQHPSAGWSEDIADALERSRQSGIPILVDFWGVACRSCTAMDATTMRNAAVRAELRDFILLKVQGDRRNDSGAAAMMRHCGVIGFPTYVVLTPPPPR